MKLEITKLRKKIYDNLKNKALSFEAPNLELEKYLHDQIELSKRKFNKTVMESLNKQILDSDIVYLGDFHTFDQNVRNVLRIVKMFLSRNTQCILGLEMVAKQHQFYIDAYLQKHLTDLEFLELINYNNSWRFPWTHYKLIFELARDFNIQIVALNTEGSLQKRDVFAANLLTETHQENPGSTLIVLYGELHICKDKIPSLMKARCPNLLHTIIHQNLDEVYWQLIKEGHEVGIVKFSPEEYCIISAPPWIKYESMIYWYENLCDDPDFDIHEYIIENGAKIFIDETNDNFFHICRELSIHLNLNISDDNLEDFSLYDHTQLDFVEESLKEFSNSKVDQDIYNFYDYLISTNKSFRFPNSNKFYCSSYSMNRISYLAGIHILHNNLQQQSITTELVLNGKSICEKFTLYVYESLYGYFFSKVINPHRKCEMYLDLMLQSEQSHQKHLAIQLLDSSDIAANLEGESLPDIYEAALLVGHILGEYFYLNLNHLKKPKDIVLAEASIGPTFSTLINLDLAQELNDTRLSQEYFYTLRERLFKNNKIKEHSKRYF